MGNIIEKIEQPTSLPIKRVVQENENVKTFYFATRLKSKPGQFVIMWLPRVDEKPFSIAYDKGDEMGLSVAILGRFTKKLFTLKAGDLVGIRGPYGTYFSLKDELKKILLVGGGYGVAPLATLVEEAINKKIDIDFCNGARSKKFLLFQERLKKLKANVYTSTDDGTAGVAGTVVDIVTELLDKNKYDCIYTCGPELMEKKIVRLAEERSIPCQVSIERYMKCGFGICGQCCIDSSGQRMCLEGPIVSGNFALAQEEFGRFHRGASGKKILF